jgi:predicted DNA-binding transcriptional regulator YafY
LRLTPAEGCSLLLGIRAMRESGIAPFDAAMESAEKKLLAAMGRDAGEAKALAASTVVAEPDRVVAGFLRELVTATRKNKRVDIDYVSASRHQGERRKVDPYGLVHHAGEWYLVGHCHKRGDVRTFRIDRVASLTVLAETFQPPAEFDLEAYRREQLYVPSADAVTVRIHLDPLAVTRVGANWPVGEVTVADDGSAELLIDCEGYEWVTGWVLGLGRHAWIQGPEDARAAMRDRIARTRTALALR